MTFFAMSRIPACAIFGLFLTVIPCARAAERNTGPWDLDALHAVPAHQFLENEASGKESPEKKSPEKEGLARPITYTGQSYRGKPTRVFAYYARPKHFEGKLPAMVLVHGGGGMAFQEWANLWAKRGYAAIAMDLAGRGADGEPLEDGGPDQTYTEKFDDIADSVENAWPYQAVANVMRAVSLLQSFPEVDADRIGITGISWGGYLTCLVAGVDDRLKVAVPVYGCGFLHENSVWLETFAKMPETDRKLWVQEFDPSQYLAGCQMPTLFVTGTNDFAYPLDSYQKSYRLVPGPTTLCLTVGMKHSQHQGSTPKEIELFVNSVLKDGTPLPKISATSRAGKQISVEVESQLPLSKAELHYTADDGKWEDRTWKTLPARLEGKTITATLPESCGVVYFLAITDERGAVVSTEHEELLSTTVKAVQE